MSQLAKKLLSFIKIVSIALLTANIFAACSFLEPSINQKTETSNNLLSGNLARIAEKAALLEKNSHLSDAEHLLEGLLKRYQRQIGYDHPDTIKIQLKLAHILEKQGLHKLAEPHFVSAHSWRLNRLGLVHPLTLATIIDLGQNYEDRGQFLKAQNIYKDTLSALTKHLGAKHNSTLHFSILLANVYRLQEAYKPAQNLLENILPILEKNMGPHHATTLKIKHDLAQIHHKTGSLSEAETHLNEVLNAKKTSHGHEHIDTLQTQHNLGNLYHKQGRLKEADDLLHQTIKTQHKILGQYHPHILDSLQTLADVKRSKGDFSAELELRHKGFLNRTHFLTRQLWQVSGNSRSGLISLHQPEQDTYLNLLTKQQPAIAGKLALEAGLLRKGLLLKVSSSIQHISSLSKDPKIAQLIKTLVQDRKKLARLTLGGPKPTDTEPYLETLKKISAKVDDAEAKLGKLSQRFQKLSTDLTVDHLAEALPKQAALVDFMIYKKDEKEHLIAAILVNNNNETIYNLLTYNDLPTINQLINNYRILIQDEDAEEEEIQEAGQALYDKLWAPLKHVIGSLKDIYLIPDGLLNITPFNALVDEKKAYLIENINLHFLTSSQELLHKRATSPRHLVTVISSPNFSADGVTDPAILKQLQNRHPAHFNADLRAMAPSGLHSLAFDPLPGSKKEGRIILSIMGNKAQETNSGFQDIIAQEQVLRRMKQAPQILHIATHGFFLEPDPEHEKHILKQQLDKNRHIPTPGDNPLLRAGLAFSGANKTAPALGTIDPDNDGILTAFEVLALDFSQTDVVVLSACETGLGEIHVGEGVYGLRRAFIEAGAGSVVNSLWEVSDSGTLQLMTGFYKNLKAGKPTHVALRDSQRSMISSSEWSFPYIWSAFYLVGH
ncbi:MAG: CHAT domain-containing protein [Magnetococcales bacterium]|nr:CHAT domain-containing protein [Magnetococcales bacterium]